MREILRTLHRDESGQDLVEYALLIALIGLSAVTGMRFLASGVVKAFSGIGSIVSSTAT